MRKYFFLLVTAISISVKGNSQKSNSGKSDPVIISSNGGEAKSASMSLQWTVGEPVVTSVTSFEKMITQGFHQSVVLGKSQIPILVKAEIKGLKINIAPNPVQSVLKLRIVSQNSERVSVYLSTLDGKNILSKVSNGTDVTTEINMVSYASGLYLLRLYNAFGLIKTFEIIKN